MMWYLISVFICISRMIGDVELEEDRLATTVGGITMTTHHSNYTSEIRIRNRGSEHRFLIIQDRVIFTYSGFLKKGFYLFFRQGKGGRKREKNIHQLPDIHPQQGIQLAT